MVSTPAVYVIYPAKCTPVFRQIVIQLYPALTQHPDARKLWRMLQWMLYSSTLEKGTGHLMVPHEMIAAAVGVHPHNGDFRSIDHLHDFSREMFPLTIHEYNRKKGRCRTVELTLPPLLRAALEQEREDIKTLPPGTSVFFETGELCTRRSEEAKGRAYWNAIQQNPCLPPAHPALPLRTWLNSQPQKVLLKVMTQNWAAVIALMEAMSETTPQEQRKKEFARRLVGDITRQMEGRRNRVPIPLLEYGVTPNSPRLFALHVNLLQLPSFLRKAALQGCIELDQRSCHLAIAARLLALPLLEAELARCLQKNVSVWSTLLTDLKLTPDDKELVKGTTLPMTYGMSKKNARVLIEHGEHGCGGLGAKVADAYFKHPLIRELQTAQEQKFEDIRAAGGATDAFGRWIDITVVKQVNPAASVWSAVLQSYELRLMASILPIIQNSGGKVQLIAWIHDGVVINVSDKRRKEVVVKQMKEAFLKTACAFGVRTDLESSP